MRTGKLLPQGKVIDHWQLLHESDWEDTDTKLLLHMDGADASVTFTDSAQGKTVTVGNHTQMDTAAWKFNGASGLFDGTDDTLSIPDSADWTFGTGDFTVDFWIRLNALTGQIIFAQWEDNNNRMVCAVYPTTNGLTFYYRENSVTLADYYGAWTPAVNTWYHVAIVRNGSNFYMFVNGAALALTTFTAIGTNNLTDIAAPLIIGYEPTYAVYLNGWMDEFRVVKGTAKWTAAFTPPTAPYLGRTASYPVTRDRNTVLMISGEGADAATTIIDETGKTVTSVGTVQIDTAQFKFGQSSVLFDGNSDCVTLAASNDWSFSGDFTIEAWVRFNSISTKQEIISCGSTSSYLGAGKWGWELVWNSNDSNLIFEYQADGAWVFAMEQAWSPATATWYHIAVVRSNGVITTYINGTQLGSTLANSIILKTYLPLTVGASSRPSGADNWFNGWLDDVRISQGIARWTSNFTPPLKTTALINGDTDEEYRLVETYVDAGTGYSYIRFNGDSGNNYGWQSIHSTGATVTANSGTTDGIYLQGSGSTVGDVACADAIIYAKSGYVRVILSNGCELTAGTTVGVTRLWGHVWNNTASPVASMILAAAGVTALSLGTKLILYRKVST